MIKEFGTIDILIDELAPCLKESITGAVKDTVVYKVETKNLLKDFNENNG